MIKDIDGFYFTDEEYNNFLPEHQHENSKEVRDLRKITQEKLLELNKDILKEIQNRKLQLFNHSNKQNITSLLFPCVYNKGKVNWLGVRYGKHPADIKALNRTIDSMSGFNAGYSSRQVQNSDENIKMQFQKHACMQINVGLNGIEIGIFHAVPNDAVDRQYLHEKLEKNENNFRDKVDAEIKKLLGYGYEWNIWNTKLENIELPDYGGANDPGALYLFNHGNTENFIDWYLDKDCVGCYSSMLVHFPRYDKRISSKETIVNTTIEIFEQLYPLYKLLSWNIHYTGEVEV